MEQINLMLKLIFLNNLEDYPTKDSLKRFTENVTVLLNHSK